MILLISKIPQKNKTLFLFLIIVLFFFSILIGCKKPIDNNAKPINCDTRWVKIFAEIHISESALESEKNEIRDSMNRVYSEQIFNNNKTTRTEFDSIYNKLVADPQKFLEFYKCVTAELEKSSNKN